MNQALVADFRVVGAADVGRFAPQMAQKLYFVAGEHSGDTRGAELMEAIRAVRPDWQFCGLGGPRMRNLAGSSVVDWVEEAAVVGFWEVLKRYPGSRGASMQPTGKSKICTPTRLSSSIIPASTCGWPDPCTRAQGLHG